MRCCLMVTALVAFMTLGAGAQIIQQAQPKPQKPLKLPPVEQIQKEIQAARSIQGAELPAGDILAKAAGEVDGEVITVDELLDEVMLKYGAPFAQHLAGQALMKMEVMKRGVEVDDEDVFDEIRYYRAQTDQAGSGLPLPEVLKTSQMGWDRFHDSIQTKAAIHKLVKQDQNITTPGPPNQFLLQIWVGGIRKNYVLETKPEKLPKGCFALIETTWGLADVLAEVVSAREDGEPYKLERETQKDGPDTLVFVPSDGGWPRFFVPDVKVKVKRVQGQKIEEVDQSASELLADVLDGKGEIAERLLVFAPGQAAPALQLPLVLVNRTAKKGALPEKVSLTEAVNAVLSGSVKVEADRQRLVPLEGDGPIFTVPEMVCESYRFPFRRNLIDVLGELAGTKNTAAPYLLLARTGDSAFYMLPPVPVAMKSQIDRAQVLGFLFGNLKLAQFEDALENMARFKAVKKSFAGYVPGQPVTGKPQADWGVVTVNEKAVADRIAHERAKYEGTIFPWEMICQILGKTVPEEMRRFWIGNGVDQIIGNEVDEATLKKYYEDHIDNFGVATAEANHILIQEKDPRTGRIDWDKARKTAEKVLAMIRTGADFGAMARKFSEDPNTRDKDGDLGLFTVVSRYDLDLCQAIFAMNPGEISEKPVRTTLGYHIVKLRRKTPPDQTKYGWASEGMVEKVREFRQDERRRAWLDKNVFGQYKLKSYLEKLFP